MKKAIQTKLILISIGIFLASFLVVTKAQYISFTTGSETLNIFCPYTRTIIFNKESDPNIPAGTILYMDFVPSDIVFWASDFTFSNLFSAGGITPSLVDGLAGPSSRLAAQRWWIDNELPDQGVVWIIDFSSKRITGTSLSFYTSGQGFTDQLSDTDLYYNNGEDILTSVSWINYTFITWLCNPDQAEPTVVPFVPDITFNTRQVWYGLQTLGPVQTVTAKIYATAGLTFRVNDWDSYSKTQPGYVTWNYPNLDLSDYRANTAWVNIFDQGNNIADRASGIDPDSLRFEFSHIGTIFTSWNVTEFTGIDYTWDRRLRDYFVWIASNQITDYGIEVAITFSGVVKDFSNKWYNFAYVFNPPIAPWLTNLDPYNGQAQILPNSDILLRIRDDWAGVDSWNIIVTVKSGTTTLGIFTGDDLHLETVIGDADKPDYNIRIYSWTDWNGRPLIFPIPTTLNVSNTITVEVSVQDVKWNTTISPYNSYSFDTRYSCESYPGCMIDSFTLYLHQSGSRIAYPFSYGELWVYSLDQVVVDTWTQILDCGTSTGAISFGIDLQGNWLSNPQEYLWEQLYIAGGNVSIHGDTITVSP